MPLLQRKKRRFGGQEENQRDSGAAAGVFLPHNRYARVAAQNHRRNVRRQGPHHHNARPRQGCRKNADQPKNQS